MCKRLGPLRVRRSKYPLLLLSHLALLNTSFSVGHRKDIHLISPSYVGHRKDIHLIPPSYVGYRKGIHLIPSACDEEREAVRLNYVSALYSCLSCGCGCGRHSFCVQL